MVSRILRIISICWACLWGVLPSPAYAATDVAASATEAPQSLANQWGGARSGPPARSGAKVAIVSEDLRNGGVLGVTLGVREAAAIIGWHTRIFDAAGTVDGRTKAIQNALALEPEGVIIVGADAGKLEPQLAQFAQRGIPIVGWHVAPKAGAMPGHPIAINVSTDPLEVARLTATAAVGKVRGKAGVVIFTDSGFEIATAKAETMAAIVRECAECRLLEIRDIAIARAADSVPVATRQLLDTHGVNWTHALAVNDIYFDYAVPELIKAGRDSAGIRLVSAGDGSASAFLRIRAGTFQTGTVAEPLNLQGWQLVDELNRLIAGEAVTGYVIPAQLVSAETLSFDGDSRLFYDPDNGYRDIYRQIWRR